MAFLNYPSYRRTETIWLGEFPKHWLVKPLWALFRRTKRSGFPDEQLLSVYRDYGVIPKSSREDNNNKPSEDLSPYQLVQPGDLVVNKMKAWQGSVAVSQHKGIVSPAYFVFEALHNENSRYLHYLLRSVRYITGYMTVSKGIRVNQWDLDPQYHATMPVLVPPIDEQTGIAKFLDRETAKIDDLVAEQERLIVLLKEKRQAVISHAVTKGLNPDVPMKDSGVEWLGEVPACWKMTRAKMVAQTFVPQRNKPELNADNFGTPWVTMENIGGKYTLPSNFYVSAEDANKAGIRVLPAGSVVASCVGNFGKSSINSAPIVINQQLQAYLPDDVLNPSFMRYLVMASQSYFELVGTAATLTYVNREGFDNLPVCLPSSDEQATIVVFLEDYENRVDQLVNEVKSAIKLLKERRSALISAAVTGKIDVRGLVDTEEAA